MRAYSEAELLLILVGVLLFIFGSICAYVLYCWNEEVFEDEDGILIYAPFSSFGTIQKELENRNLEILSSGFERIPQITKTLTEAEMADVEKLIEKLEEDDDVMNVYHTMEEA